MTARACTLLPNAAVEGLGTFAHNTSVTAMLSMTFGEATLLLTRFARTRDTTRGVDVDGEAWVLVLVRLNGIRMCASTPAEKACNHRLGEPDARCKRFEQRWTSIDSRRTRGT